MRPADHRFDDIVRKGYRREDFHDAWSRYLPPVADVAHVAHPASKTGEADAVAPTEDNEGAYLHKVSNNGLPSTPRKGNKGNKRNSNKRF